MVGIDWRIGLFAPCVRYKNTWIRIQVVKICEEELMPLTEDGKKVLRNMIDQYGSKKGKEVFYASINKKKKGSSKWHLK